MNRRERSDLLSHLRRDARCIAGHFQLHYRGIAAEHPRVKSRYGACYEDGLIKIRLNHATTGRALKYSSLIDTLCHELAHLRHFNHGPEFKAFFLQLLRWARREGIYQPGPAPGSRGKRQAVRTSSALDHRPFAQELLHRNGIPVFPPLDLEGAQKILPWERLMATPAPREHSRRTEDLPAAPRDPDTPVPPDQPLGRSRRGPKRQGTTKTPQRTAPGTTATPGSSEDQTIRAPEQLSLF